MKTRLLMAGLVVFGGWQLGYSSYLLAKAELAQWLLEQAWQEMRREQAQSIVSNSHQAQPLRMQQGIAPWPWADTWPLAKLSWPALNQELIVLAGASGRNLAFGPAHLSASVAPGATGVSVIGGHRDTHFAFLSQAKLGDRFVIERADGRQYRFQVKEILITDVRESHIGLDSDVAKIALVACYPFADWQSGEAGGASSPLRYLVLAEQVGSQKLEQVPPTTAKMLATIGL